MTTPPTRRHARRPSERPPVLIRLVQTSDLPDGINSLASADGGTVTSPADSLLHSVLPSLPVPVPSVSVSASLPPVPIPSLLPVQSPSPTCLQLGPLFACVSP